jgi:glycosyltransferase involved in cell wall biosynthesis
MGSHKLQTMGLLMKKRVWIAWEKQRRSLVLSKELNCELHIFNYSGSARYVICIYKTINILIKNKPDILFVQNPSMILAALTCFLKMFFNYKIIVDRHSTFRIGKSYKNKIDTNRLYKYVYDALNNYTLNRADLTIVTNKYLADVVVDYGGRSFVLPDKIPELVQTSSIELKGRDNIFLISSFSQDEPFGEIFSAMKMLCDTNIYLYISGNPNKLDRSVYDLKPENVVLTGFLTEQDFVNTIYSADAIMALTTSDYTMLCSCYEAYAAGKPLITSKMDVLTEYFIGARFVENRADDIRLGILDVLSSKHKYRDRIIESKNEIISRWTLTLSSLELML